MYQDYTGNMQNPMTMNPAYQSMPNYMNRYPSRQITPTMNPLNSQPPSNNSATIIFVGKAADVDSVPVMPNQSIWIMATNDAILARKTADGIGIPSVEYCRLERINKPSTDDSDGKDSPFLTKQEFYQWVEGQKQTPVSPVPTVSPAAVPSAPIRKKKEDTVNE